MRLFSFARFSLFTLPSPPQAAGFSRAATAFAAFAVTLCVEPLSKDARADVAAASAADGGGSQPIAAAKTYLVTDFGAKGDGATLDTTAIQRALDASGASEAGGRVVIPRGVFLSGSLFLRRGVELHLTEGAVLRGSTDIEQYPKRLTRIEGHFEPWRMALVNAERLDRVHITGTGIIDGNGVPFWEAFWQRRKQKPKCTNLEVERPRLLFIDRCQNVRIADVSLQDSGFWNLHLYRCSGVKIEGVRITIPSAARLGIRGPSTDGIDIDSSREVVIRNCYISTNDDNIALKGTKGPLADRDQDSPPVEDILVENVECGDGNGLITCGSEATLVRRVTVRNCRMTGKATVLTLKLRPDTPQRYEDITLDGIELAGGGRLLNVAPWTQFFDLKGQPAPSRTVQRITLRNVRGTYGSFGTLRGNPGDRIGDVLLENMDLKFTGAPRLAVGDGVGIEFRQVLVGGESYRP